MFEPIMIVFCELKIIINFLQYSSVSKKQRNLRLTDRASALVTGMHQKAQKAPRAGGEQRMAGGPAGRQGVILIDLLIEL